MLLKSNVILFFSLVFVLALQADITHVSKWDRRLDTGEVQSIFFFGDIHNKSEVGFEQAQYIADFMAQYAGNNGCVLLEAIDDAESALKRRSAFYEVYDYPEDYNVMQAELNEQEGLYKSDRIEAVQNKENSALFIMPHLCDEKSVRYENVDFRQSMTCDSPRLAINKYQDGHLIVPFVIQQLYSEIAAYNDTPELNAFYSKALNYYKPFMDLICTIMREQKIIFQDLPDYFARILMKDPFAFDLQQFKAAEHTAFNYYHKRLNNEIESLRSNSSECTKEHLVNAFIPLFDLSSVELIDAYTLHLIYSKQIASNASSTISVVVGRGHMLAAEKFLSQLGYKKVDELLNGDKKGVDIASFCLKYLQKDQAIKVEKAIEPDALVWSRIVAAIEYVLRLFGL